MQRRAICSEAMTARNDGVYRVLLTVVSDVQPEYILINLIGPPREDQLEQGKMYRITIEEED